MVKVIGYDEEIGVCGYQGNDFKKPIKAELIRGQHSVMEFSMVSQQLKWVMGEVLTVIEAVVDDERKLKATKDIIKKTFSAKISWIYELCGMPEESQEGLVEPED